MKIMFLVVRNPRSDRSRHLMSYTPKEPRHRGVGSQTRPDKDH